MNLRSKLLMMAVMGMSVPYASASAQLNPEDTVTLRVDTSTFRYQCENGMEAYTQFLSVDEISLMKLTLPSSRAGDGKRQLILPLSQSGSGVRYATDLISFHIKGDTAILASLESAITDEISSVRCARK